MSDILTDAEIAAIAGRLASPTEGSWSAEPRDTGRPRHFGWTVVAGGDLGVIAVGEPDARFIAAARSDMPRLIISHAALRDALAQTAAALRQIPALWYARNQGSTEWLKAVDAILTLAEDTLDAITSESH